MIVKLFSCGRKWNCWDSWFIDSFSWLQWFKISVFRVNGENLRVNFKSADTPDNRIASPKLRLRVRTRIQISHVLVAAMSSSYISQNFFCRQFREIAQKTMEVERQTKKLRRRHMKWHIQERRIPMISFLSSRVARSCCFRLDNSLDAVRRHVISPLGNRIKRALMTLNSRVASSLFTMRHLSLIATQAHTKEIRSGSIGKFDHRRPLNQRTDGEDKTPKKYQ